MFQESLKPDGKAFSGSVGDLVTCERGCLKPCEKIHHFACGQAGNASPGQGKAFICNLLGQSDPFAGMCLRIKRRYLAASYRTGASAKPARCDGSECHLFLFEGEANRLPPLSGCEVHLSRMDVHIPCHKPAG